MRILVAEDHATLAQSIVQGLREEGYAVDWAAGGDEALQLSQAHPYDGMVLDLMLPGTDGWTVLKTLRDAGNAVPILCLTACDSIEDRVRGLELGGDDYLVKPFAWEELLARVRSLVRRGYNKRGTVIQIADLSVDTAGKRVTRGGERVELSAREYALLEYLAYRHDEVVTRSDVWAHLYDQNDENTSNVVDVFVAHLRNKIDRNREPKLIHTRRGQGYVLSAQA
jgi:DNA-binding response OmpR family regulator